MRKTGNWAPDEWHNRTLMRKTGNWAPDEWHNRTLIWGALWWCNGQIRDPSDDEIGAPWWPDGKIWGPRPLILLKRYNTAPLHSFKLMGPKFKLEKIRCHACWKRKHGVLNLHCSFYISKIVWWFIPMFDFGIFCHLLRLMGNGDISGGGPVRVFEHFCSLFSFFPFLFVFSILHYFPSLSRWTL